MADPEIKVFLAPERRSKAPLALTLLMLLLFGAAGYYLLAQPPSPQATKPAPNPPPLAATPSPQHISILAAQPAPPPAFIDAHFDRDTDGFQYVDDAFRGTKQPEYAEGARMEADAPQGGVLHVKLGGRDSKDIRGMSGGWRRTFTIPQLDPGGKAAPLMLSFRYILTQNSDYETDEISQALVTVDSLQPGNGGKDYLAQFTGDGNGGPNPTTGWQTFAVSLGALMPGEHVLTIGAFNNRKTAVNETTEVRIDDVRIEVEPPGGVRVPAPPPAAMTPTPAPKPQRPGPSEKPDETF